MRKIILGIFTLAVPLILTACAGNQTLEQTKFSIVVTSPEIVPILDELEVDDVVGIIEMAELPARYQEVATIGSAEEVDITAIMEMEPSIILSSNHYEEAQSPLFIERSIDSAFANLSTTTEMMQSIRDIGPLIDREEQANKVVDEFQDFIKELRNEVAGQEISTVLILVGDADGYKVANETSYIGNLVKLSGGLNVFGDEHEDEYLAISEEEIKEANPDIILRLPSSDDEAIHEMFANEFSNNEMWASLDAIENEKVHDLSYRVFGDAPRLDYQEPINQLKDLLN